MLSAFKKTASPNKLMVDILITPKNGVKNSVGIFNKVLPNPRMPMLWHAGHAVEIMPANPIPETPLAELDEKLFFFSYFSKAMNKEDNMVINKINR